MCNNEDTFSEIQRQVFYDEGYKHGNKKTLLEFGLWLLIGFVLGIVVTILFTS